MVRPASVIERCLSARELADFRAQGFVIVDRPVFSPAELAAVRARMAAIFDRRGSIATELVHDLGEAGQRVDEIVWPSRLDPALKRSAVFLRARRLAAGLLDSAVSFHFDHLIDKPPRSGGVTQWHQDLAFEADPGPKVTLWIPLVDVDERNGCMVFAPLREERLVEHERVGTSGLRVVGADLSEQVAAPLRAGGLTAHRELTLHSTGANVSDGPRPAWVLRFRADQRSRLRRTMGEVVGGTASLPPLHRVARLKHASRGYRITSP